MCRIEECDLPSKAYDLCNGHLSRKLHGQTGDAFRAPIRRKRMWGFKYLNRVITYHSAHERVRVMWGSASNYPCVDCGVRASDWSYDGTDPTELRGESRGGSECSYSIWPEFYAPRCKKCHSVHDHGAPPPVNDEPEW